MDKKHLDTMSFVLESMGQKTPDSPLLRVPIFGTLLRVKFAIERKVKHNWLKSQLQLAVKRTLHRLLFQTLVLVLSRGNLYPLLQHKVVLKQLVLAVAGNNSQEDIPQMRHFPWQFV